MANSGGNVDKIREKWIVLLVEPEGYSKIKPKDRSEEELRRVKLERSDLLRPLMSKLLKHAFTLETEPYWSIPLTAWGRTIVIEATPENMIEIGNCPVIEQYWPDKPMELI